VADSVIHELGAADQPRDLILGRSVPRLAILQIQLVTLPKIKGFLGKRPSGDRRFGFHIPMACGSDESL
jgi:hypothetical protein